MHGRYLLNDMPLLLGVRTVPKTWTQMPAGKGRAASPDSGDRLEQVTFKSDTNIEAFLIEKPVHIKM